MTSTRLMEKVLLRIPGDQLSNSICRNGWKMLPQYPLKLKADLSSKRCAQMMEGTDTVRVKVETGGAGQRI